MSGRESGTTVQTEEDMEGIVRAVSTANCTTSHGPRLESSTSVYKSLLYAYMLCDEKNQR